MKKLNFRKFLGLAALLLGLTQFGGFSRTFAQDAQPEFRLTNIDGNQVGDRLIYDCGVFKLVDNEEAREAFFFQIPVDSLEVLKKFGDENKCDVLNVNLIGRRADGTELKVVAPVKFRMANLKNEPIQSLAFFIAREDLPNGTYEIKIIDGSRLKPSKEVKPKDRKEKAVVGSFKNVEVVWRG